MSLILSLIILAVCIYIIIRSLYRKINSDSSCSCCSNCSSCGDFCQYYDDGFLEDEIDPKLFDKEKMIYYREGNNE